MSDKLIEEYKEAYAAGNPDKPPVEVTYRNGWYYIKDSLMTSPYRKDRLVQMRDKLREKAKWIGTA